MSLKRRSLPQPERRSRAEEKLIQAAIACIAQCGVEGLKLQDVGDRAGLARTLIAHHFGDKAGLIARVVDHLLAASDLQRFAEPAGLGPRALIDSVGGYFSSLVANPAASRALLMFEAQAFVDPAIATKLNAMNAKVAATLQHHLQAGIDRGEVGHEVHAQNQAVLIYAQLKGVIAAYLHGPSGVTPETLEMSLVKSLEKVILTGPNASPQR